jgi:hydrogenase nickel incorporation protein HypA/HybF
MHELSIAQNIVDIVLQHLPEETNDVVRIVKIRVGVLSGIVSKSLDFCFSSIVADTPLRDARLDIEDIPVEARCLTCEHSFSNDDVSVYICPDCGSKDLHFLKGTELEVVEIVVEDE